MSCFSKIESLKFSYFSYENKTIIEISIVFCSKLWNISNFKRENNFWNISHFIKNNFSVFSITLFSEKCLISYDLFDNPFIFKYLFMKYNIFQKWFFFFFYCLVFYVWAKEKETINSMFHNILFDIINYPIEEEPENDIIEIYHKN